VHNGRPDFRIEIDDHSLAVRLNVAPRTRFYACIFFVATVVLLVCALAFLPGKHGRPSMWHDLKSSPAETVSKVPWLDIHNKHWDSRSYTLTDIVDLRYQAIARAKGSSIYGLCFVAAGRAHRVLPGLKPREADKILKALKALGADVPDDPTLSRKLAEDICD
jgi:hypothetical protein